MYKNYLGLAKNKGENMLAEEVACENYDVAEEVFGYQSARKILLMVGNYY